jgi:hypothetical protein
VVKLGKRHGLKLRKMGAADVRLNVKRILFIVICAEALLVYWSRVELYEIDRREMLTRNHTDSGIKSQPPPDYKDM